MGPITKRLKTLKPWHLGGLLGLAVLLLLAGSIGYGTTGLSGQFTPPRQGDDSPAGASPTGAAQSQPAPPEIAVKSRLVFPLRDELSFERAGEVEEILVSEGEWVAAGQALARLNTDHFPALEEELARLRYQVAEEQDRIQKINRDYRGEPLLAAQRAETVARLEYANTQAEDFLEDFDRNYADALKAARDRLTQAGVSLDTARDDWAAGLRDLDANHAQVLAEAFQSRADAELALDQAIEQLDDYQEDLGDDAIRAQDRVTEAELALDLAIDRLSDYQEDLGDDAIRTQDRITAAELALDLDKDRLEDFITEHDRQVIRARTLVGTAEDALDAAQEPLTAFLRSPTRDLDADGKPVDVAKLRSLQAAVDLAESDLTQSRDDLAELEEGPDSFRLQELESNVTVAELNLTRARDDLAELEEGPDQLILKQLQARVDLAQVILAQAEKFLAEELEGPDRLILRRLSLAVDLAETRLKLAEQEVNDLVADGPDQAVALLREKEIATRRAEIDQLYEEPDSLRLAQIGSLEAGITQAQERMDDIREEMEETLLRAPFDGVIFLLNVAVDDRVNEHSRVMELLDPREVLVAGLVNATEVRFISAGAAARVAIGSLPGRELTATVTEVAEVPNTERGIISYPVTIQVNLPAGLEVPPRLSAVTSVIMP